MCPSGTSQCPGSFPAIFAVALTSLCCICMYLFSFLVSWTAPAWFWHQSLRIRRIFWAECVILIPDKVFKGFRQKHSLIKKPSQCQGLHLVTVTWTLLEEQRDPRFKVLGWKLQCHNPYSRVWAAINEGTSVCLSKINSNAFRFLSDMAFISRNQYEF